MQQLLSTHRDEIKSTVLIGTPLAVAGALLLRSWHRSRSLPPGPPSVPFVGCPRMLDQSQLHVAIHRSRQQYGDIFSFGLGCQTIIAVTEYQMIKEMLEKSEFAGRPRIPIVERIVQNCGLIFSEGEPWSHQRRLSLRVLRDFGFAREKSVEMVDNALDGVFQEMDSLCQLQKPAQLLEIFLSASNSIIAQLTFGRLFDRNEKEYAEFCKALKSLISNTVYSPVVLYPMIDYIIRLLPEPKGVAAMVETMQSFVRSQIRLREQLMVDEDCEPDCLCDAYIQEKRKAEQKGDFETFKQQQLVRVCMELFFAGTDTTARSVEWLMLFMAFNPDIQRKVQAELDSVVGQSRRPRISDKTELHYVCAVIDEGYRKTSLVPVGVFHRAMHDTYFRGHFIPSDAIVQPCLYSVHHDEKLWDKPNEFYPEHFLDDNGRYKSSPYCIPFLIGKRSCLGESLARMEIFLLFTSVMQRYSVKPSVDSLRNKDSILAGYFGALAIPGNYGLAICRR